MTLIGCTCGYMKGPMSVRKLLAAMNAACDDPECPFNVMDRYAVLFCLYDPKCSQPGVHAPDCECSRIG